MQIKYTNDSIKSLKRLDKKTVTRIRTGIKGLAENPPSGDIRKLIGKPGYRLRVGKYRVLFEIDNSANIILIVDVAPRGKIYKG